MNTKWIAAFFAAAMLTTALACGGREEFDFNQGVPEKKAPLPARVKRNPFQISVAVERPLPLLRDKDDPAIRLPLLLAPHIRAVLRQPKLLLMIDAKVYQAGDEIHLSGTSALDKFNLVLRSIELDRLVFNLTSLDAQQPGQVDCFVPLSREMRKGL